MKLTTASLAMERAAAAAGREYGRGLTRLATIAVIAPFVGFLGTLYGIINSFKGVGTDKTTAMAAIAESLSAAGAPSAFGLLTGLVAYWGYRYLRERLAVMEREMELAMEETVELCRPWGAAPASGSLAGFDAVEGRQRWTWVGVVAGLLIVGAGVAEWRICEGFGYASPGGAASAVVVRLALSAMVAWAVWVDLLKREARGAVCLAAVLALAWSVAAVIEPGLLL